MIRHEHLLRMKPDAMLVNTPRGGIIKEGDLTEVHNARHLWGAAIEAFEQETYCGVLMQIDRC